MKRRLLLLVLPLPVLAQTQPQTTRVYRCGPEGRQLSDRPCDGDLQGREVRHHEPSAADRRAAQERAREDRRLANALEEERRRDARQAAKEPGRLDAPRPADPAGSRSTDRADKVRVARSAPTAARRRRPREDGANAARPASAPGG